MINTKTFHECKIFTTTDEQVDEKLLEFCKQMSEYKQLSVKGTSLSIINVGVVDNLLQQWKREMKDITPYYAMKALPDDQIIDKMSFFDCASPSEFKQVIARGKDPKNIIYANTAKSAHDILDAKNHGICLMTVDGIWEAEKILDIYPECGIVLRIAPSDEGASNTTFAHKFGTVSTIQSRQIIDMCIRNLKGFSFHVGSGQTNYSAWYDAVAIVDELFRYVRDRYAEYYDQVNIVDIGGGFSTGVDALKLTEIRASLAPWMEVYSDKCWIAEPGRFFSADAMTLLCPIISKNLRANDRQYYVLGNSIHHSFSCIILDHREPRPLTPNDWSPGLVLCDGSLVGQTCDGIDILYHGLLPHDLPLGTILIFQGMGAYSNASANHFNGFLPPESVYYM